MEKELEVKASALATAYNSLSSSDSESVAPSLFVSRKNNGGVGSENTTDCGVINLKPSPPKEGSDGDLVDTKNNVDGMNSAGVSACNNKPVSITKATSSKPHSDSDEWKDPITKRGFKLQKLKDDLVKKHCLSVKGLKISVLGV